VLYWGDEKDTVASNSSSSTSDKSSTRNRHPVVQHSSLHGNSVVSCRCGEQCTARAYNEVNFITHMYSNAVCFIL
jgi:hypothetical protein